MLRCWRSLLLLVPTTDAAPPAADPDPAPAAAAGDDCCKPQVADPRFPRHTFDGDGMVLSLAFSGDGRAFFRNKFVRTKGFLAEQVRQCARGSLVARGRLARGRPAQRAVQRKAEQRKAALCVVFVAFLCVCAFRPGCPPLFSQPPPFPRCAGDMRAPNNACFLTMPSNA